MRRLAALAAGALLVSACAHGPAHKPGEEYLDKVEFHGNKELHDGALLTGLGLHRTLTRGRAPDPYQIQVDADRIRGKYVRHGFLDIDVRARTERAGDKATVIYTVDEGARATTAVSISGLDEHDPDLTTQKVRDALPLSDGAPFDYNVFDLAKPKLLAVAQNAGYAHAKLDASVTADPTAHVATVVLDYALGPKCKFGAVKIVGVDGELRQAVADRVQFAPGEAYSVEAIVRTQRELSAFGRFSSVRVEPDAGGDATVGVSISVSESARHELKLGGGFGIDPQSYEVRARMGYSVVGWPFPLDTASVDLRPAYALLRDTNSVYEPRIRALAKIERADLFWTYTTATVAGGYNYLAVEAYTSYGPVAQLGFQTRLGTPRVLARVGWSFNYVDFRDINALIDPALQMQIGLDHPERIGEYQQSITVDLRDNPIEPHWGAYAGMQVNEGTRYAGGGYDFVQLVPELRAYASIPATDIVLAARARSGMIMGDVPATERFFAGGASSQRGFSERHLSPSVTGPIDGSTYTIPYGGAGLIETSVELRVPLFGIKNMPLGFVTFLDGGDVTETPGELDPMHLHWALGGGLRLLTPIGPVRFDLGFRLNRMGGPDDPSPGDTYAFHLSIGEAF